MEGTTPVRGCGEGILSTQGGCFNPRREIHGDEMGVQVARRERLT